MISMLDLQSEGRWFEPGLCHCVAQEILLHVVCLHPCVEMGTGNHSAEVNPNLAYHLGWGGGSNTPGCFWS